MPTLAIFGQTGTGKTSLSNALFGLDWRTDDAISCTQEVTQHNGAFINTLSQGDTTWQLLDTPGVGESKSADEEHFREIYDAFHSADVVLWVRQADTRTFKVDQESILELTNKRQKFPNAHFVIAVNQIDKVYPENWDTVNNQPSVEQAVFISEISDLILHRMSPYLPVERHCVIPCTVSRNYGLVELVQAISQIHHKEI